MQMNVKWQNKQYRRSHRQTDRQTDKQTNRKNHIVLKPESAKLNETSFLNSAIMHLRRFKASVFSELRLIAKKAL